MSVISDNGELGALVSYPACGEGRPHRAVLAHGVFDLLHLGHIRHLQEAAKLGNYLIVSVAADKHVQKGLGRPHFNQNQRAEALRALECVDEVIINDEYTAVSLIHKLKPAIYVKGVDYVGVKNEGLEQEREAIQAVGGQMKFTSSHKWSSSSILKAEKFSDEVCAYLDRMKRDGCKDKILDAFQKADEKNILFVGESILDIYRYVQGLGRPSKELMLATVETNCEFFAGGIQASAKHGEWPRADYLTNPSTTGITKTRYVDQDFNRKLFDVYSVREIKLDPEQRECFRNKLQDAIGISDVVIVNDFGHGLLGFLERRLLQDSGFLAVNCQTNAGNYGYNLVTKYSKADYVCIDEPEARLALAMQKGPLEEGIHGLRSQMQCNKFLITHGRHGSHWFKGHGLSITMNEVAPALAQGGIDTMGAGDAVMAVTAPLVAVGLDMASVALVGNIVGAIKVSILGHRRHVQRDEIIQTLEALLA